MVFSGLKILAIAFIVAVGIITAIINQCYPSELDQPFQPLEGHEPTPSTVALALYSVMWAYDGW
jgi:amino acid transporter